MNILKLLLKKKSFNYVDNLPICNTYYPSVFLVTNITSAAKK